VNDILSCDATKCAFNNNHQCTASFIMIQSPAARASKNTWCDSYREGTPDMAYPMSSGDSSGSGINLGFNEAGLMANLHDPVTIMGEALGTEIGCEATHCVYNQSLRCTAQVVRIADPERDLSLQACCRSFKPAT
jgi:hypothetical protein